MSPSRDTSKIDATYLDSASLPFPTQPTDVDSELSSVVDEQTAGTDYTPKETDAQAVRVLHVINGEYFAGAERVQDLLAGRLGRFGYEVGFACLKPGEFPTARKYTQAPLYETPMRGRFDLGAARRLARLATEGNYQILHSHSVRSAMIALLAATWSGLPLVHHVHSPVSRDTERWLRSRINGLVERLYLTRANRLITVSHSLAQHVARLSSRLADRITVVPNGVPCRTPVPHHPPATLPTRTPVVGPIGEAWLPEPSGINYFGISNDLYDATYIHLPPSDESQPATWTLGTVALFRPRKGIETLLESLAQLKDRDVPVKLLAVGGFVSQEYEDQTKTLADSLGVADMVEWTGFTHDVDAQLSRMDAFILPSLYGEGLPMVVLEAMAAGVPVIASNVEGIPEAIRDGKDGLIAEPGNATDLADKIRSLTDGSIDYRAMQESARRRQVKHFSEDSMARGVARVYDSLLEKG